jgi:hypothetical protein
MGRGEILMGFRWGNVKDHGVDGTIYIQMDHTGTRWDVMEYINLPQDRDKL